MVSFCVAGYPAAGKSTSIFPNEQLNIKGLDPLKTMYINCAGEGKRILYPKWREVFKAGTSIKEGGRYYASRNPRQISELIKYVAKERKDVNFIVIDDANLVMGMQVLSATKKMERDDWATLATNTWSMFNVINEISSNPELNRSDLFIIYTMHLHTKETYNDSLGQVSLSSTKHVLATSGQMINNNVPLASIWDIIIVANCRVNMTTGQPEYFFETRPIDNTPARAPIGMFGTSQFTNDLGAVVDAICAYDGITL